MDAAHGRHVSFAPSTHYEQQEQHLATSNAHAPPQSDLQATIIEPLHETVPLSALPGSALTTDSSANAKQQHSSTSSTTSSSSSATVPLSALTTDGSANAKQHSSASSTTSSSSAMTAKTGRLSQLVAAEKAKVAEAGLHINRPRQVTGLPTKYHKALAWAGRVGWVGKAVVYATIGGIACRSAVGGDRPNPNLAQTEQVSASPQGAFVLLGATASSGVSIVVLLIMMAALVAYITWRFWEGLAGQGYDETFSAKKNFFKFRVSPIVSGAVYVSYLIFLITLLDREVRHIESGPGPAKEGWPSTWRHTPAGRVGLALLGIAFIIATCIQLQGVCSRQWHRDYRSDLPRPLMLAVFTIGHFGFAGRAGAFLSMAVLFFKDAGGVEDTPHEASMVANALDQLQGSRGLRAILMIVGLLLVIYGLFAVLSAFTRMFPTPPPSRRKRLPAAEYKEHKEHHHHHHLHHHPHVHHHHHHNNTNDRNQQQHNEPKCCWPLPWQRHCTNNGHSNHSSMAAGGHGVSSYSQNNKSNLSVASSSSDAMPPPPPVTLDASPGWGSDQGLSNSHSLRQELQQASRPATATATATASAPPAGPSPYDTSAAATATAGPTPLLSANGGGPGMTNRSAHDDILDHMLVLPRYHVQPPGTPADRGSAGSSVPGSTTPGMHRLVPQQREFVTIDI